MMTFVDTGAWFASVVPRDPGHGAVIAYMNNYPGVLLTTDYVIDEALTLLRSRGEGPRAVQLGRELYDLTPHRIHFIDRTDIRAAWELFRGEPQRAWSFTDCTSKVVIERLHIKQVLTFDHHFREFGALMLVP